jgi:hypothetical protein
MGSPLPISINTGAPSEIWSALAPIILARSYRVNLVSLTYVTSKQIPESLINALFMFLVFKYEVFSQSPSESGSCSIHFADPTENGVVEI